MRLPAIFTIYCQIKNLGGKLLPIEMGIYIKLTNS